MNKQIATYAEFENNNMKENAKWNIVNNTRYRNIKKINEEILNRQLSTIFDFKKTEGFDTVGEYNNEIYKLSQQVDDHRAQVEISELSVNSERMRLYGWSILTVLTLTGGILITTMN